MENSIVEYSYIIRWKDNYKKIILKLTPDRMNFVPENFENNFPEWVELNFQKCEICPLTEKDSHYCPAAQSIFKLVNEFKNVPSTENVKIEIDTPERKIINKVTAQDALSSLMGLCFGLSKCPILKNFAPMARFHLPLATTEETIFRTVSSYLIKQYFINKKGGTPDWELKGLKKFYSQVAKVNIHLAERIRAGSKEDASVNAVVILDTYTKNVDYLFENSIETLEKIYS